MAVTAGDRRTLTGREIATRERSLDSWSMADWLPNPDPVLKALGRDIAVYRDLRSDAHVGGCIRRRKAAVMGLEQDLDRARAPARVAKAIEGWLADLPLSAILGELLDASLYGYQPAEITWVRVGSLLVPTEIIGKPPEWFHYDAENRLRFRSREAGVSGELLPERKFLVARQEPSYANPYGQPDLAMVFWPSAFKKGGLKFWVSFTERYGSPFLIGRLPRPVSPAETNALADRLEAMIQDAVAVIPNDASVEIVEASGKTGSAEVYRELLTFCRSEVSIALLGQNQTTEAEANRASAQAGLEVGRDIRDGDVAMLASAMQQLIDWVVELNWPGAESPRWSLREQEEIDEARPRRDQILVQCGVKFSRRYWLETYGLEEADLKADSVEGQDGDTLAGIPPGELNAYSLGIRNLAALMPIGEAFIRRITGIPAPVAPEPPPGPGDPVALSSSAHLLPQDQIDAAADQDPGYQAAMEQLLARILAALDEGLTPEEILAMLDEWYPKMDDAALLALLERGVAAADAIGRIEANAEALA